MSGYMQTPAEEEVPRYTTVPTYIINLNSEMTANAVFEYNYYTTDEGVSEVTSLSAIDADSDQYDFVVENIEKGTSPRQVRLKFVNTVKQIDFSIEKEERINLQAIVDDGKIVYEDAPISNLYTAIGVYDTSVDEKVYALTQNLSASLDSDSESGFLSAAKQQAAGVGFSKAQASENTVKLYQNDVKSKTLMGTYNKLFISDIVKTTMRWQSSAYVDEYASLFNSVDEKQTKARREIRNPLQITESECDIDLPIFTRSAALRTTGAGYLLNNAKRVGILIEKYGEQLDGTTLRYKDRALFGKNVTSYVDREVRYGAVYKYKIRSLFVKTVMCDTASGQTFPGKVLIASTGTTVAVQCIEKDPPPPPNNISFQQTLDGLYIRWNFPINPQKDIKRFQVFRRKSITDPFELIQEINFDKSILPFTSGETVPDELVTITPGPIKHYLDTSFKTISSDYIYALCCIDAHGFTSNFSEQFRVRFDRLTSKIQITRVAAEGSPKAYPNSTVLGDFFADLIKDSGRRRIRLYFDPEYTDVTRDGQSLNLIQTSNAGLVTHRLVLTELMLAQSQNVDIVIGNKRLDATGIPPAIGRFYISR